VHLPRLPIPGMAPKRSASPGSPEPSSPAPSDAGSDSCSDGQQGWSTTARTAHAVHMGAKVSRMLLQAAPPRPCGCREILAQVARAVVSQGATLDIGPWRNVAALPTVRLGTCLARRRRGQRGHAARGEARRRSGCSGWCTRGHLGHLSLSFPANLSVPFFIVGGGGRV
jgi:hypothetical protein